LLQRKQIEEEKRVSAEEQIVPKLSKFQKFALFLKSPLARVILFVLLGTFLLSYLTHSSINQLPEAPYIILLVVLFIILVLGRGGKSKSLNTDLFS